MNRYPIWKYVILVVALVVLPLLPDRAMGPYEAWNPRQIWMVVVLVAVLAMVAVPSYRSHVLRTHRVEARTALLALAVALILIQFAHACSPWWRWANTGHRLL